MYSSMDQPPMTPTAQYKPTNGTSIQAMVYGGRQELHPMQPAQPPPLSMVMMDFMFRQKRKYTAIKRDRLSIKEKLAFLKKHLTQGDSCKFIELVDSDGDRTVENTVITFISLLELARLKRIKIFQNEDKGTIYIDVVKSLEDFDVHQATGFEDEDEDTEDQAQEKDENLDLSEGAIVPPVPALETQVPVVQ